MHGVVGNGFKVGDMSDSKDELRIPRK
jgi:hypothetical protein